MALAAAVSPPSCSTNRAKRAAIAPGDAVPHMKLKLSKISQLANLPLRNRREESPPSASDGLDIGHRQPPHGPVERDLSRAPPRVPDRDLGPSGRGDGRARRDCRGDGVDGQTGVGPPLRPAAAAQALDPSRLRDGCAFEAPVPAGPGRDSRARRALHRPAGQGHPRSAARCDDRG